MDKDDASRPPLCSIRTPIQRSWRDRARWENTRSCRCSCRRELAGDGVQMWQVTRRCEVAPRRVFGLHWGGRLKHRPIRQVGRPGTSRRRGRAEVFMAQGISMLGRGGWVQQFPNLRLRDRMRLRVGASCCGGFHTWSGGIAALVPWTDSRPPAIIRDHLASRRRLRRGASGIAARISEWRGPCADVRERLSAISVRHRPPSLEA